jgi:hypothetical protein
VGTWRSTTARTIQAAITNDDMLRQTGGHNDLLCFASPGCKPDKAANEIEPANVAGSNETISCAPLTPRTEMLRKTDKNSLVTQSGAPQAPKLAELECLSQMRKIGRAEIAAFGWERSVRPGSIMY